jgi:hypothetical protein
MPGKRPEIRRVDTSPAGRARATTSVSDTIPSTTYYATSTPNPTPRQRSPPYGVLVRRLRSTRSRLRRARTNDGSSGSSPHPTLLIRCLLPAAAPPPAFLLHAWAALPGSSCRSRKGGPARSGGPPFLRKPRRGAKLGPEAGRRPVRLQDEQPEPNTKKRTPRNEQSRGWKRTVHESATAGLGADPPAQAAAGRIARRSRRDCDGPPPRGLFDPRRGGLILRGARGLTSGCARCRRSSGPCR